jgi:hypothetical protein
VVHGKDDDGLDKNVSTGDEEKKSDMRNGSK